MNFLSVSIWLVGRRKMSQVRHLRLLGLLATSTWLSLLARTLST
uniref:Uncharacterized protein n=1 Tax=Lotus japonicus TaxID=34305 RepID=I3SRI7_LOTJA|nr:unknown [Lotus japonicus]